MVGKRKNGFTLAELLIVVAIISILVAISIPIFTSQLEKSRESTDMANIRSAYAEIMADAERKALEEYKKSGETKAVGYVVTFNSDGTFILTAVKNKQIFHTKNTASLVREGYMVAVKDGKVGSNLKYDPETKTLIGTPYHIYVSQWHNDTEGINFGY